MSKLQLSVNCATEVELLVGAAVFDGDFSSELLLDPEELLLESEELLELLEPEDESDEKNSRN